MNGMENDRIVCRIFVMAVFVPIVGKYMNLNTSGPDKSVNSDFRLDEIRSAACIPKTRMQDINRLSGAKPQRRRVEKPV
jgi:hypothetical protein